MPAIVDKAAKRAEIVRHAADVFSRYGYNATKMQDIANAADIGKGTIYEYVRTKEELFLAVYDAWMSAYETLIRERVAACTDPLAKVDAIRDSAVEFYTSRAEQAPLLLEFWAHALRTDNPAFLERITRTRTFLRDLGSKLTRELVAAGWVRNSHASLWLRDGSPKSMHDRSQTSKQVSATVSSSHGSLKVVPSLCKRPSRSVRV